MLASFDEITSYTAKMKRTVGVESLNSAMDKLTKTGVNAADTWDAYKEERDEFIGYRSREQQWKAENLGLVSFVQPI